MVVRKPVEIEGLPTPGGAYSRAMIAGDLVFTTGFGPHDPISKDFPADFEGQTRAMLKNLETALVAAGSGLDLLVKTTVHLADINDWAEFNRIYAEVIPEPRPVRTTVQSGLPGFLVEIDAVAVLRD